MKLNKERKYEAHRVISPIVLKLVGTEEITVLLISMVILINLIYLKMVVIG